MYMCLADAHIYAHSHLFDPSTLVFNTFPLALKRFVHTGLCLLPLMANRFSFLCFFVLVSARLHPFSPIRTRFHLIHTHFRSYALVHARPHSFHLFSTHFDAFALIYTRFNASVVVLVRSHLYLLVPTHPCRSLLVPAAAGEDITKGYLSRRL